MDRSHRKLAYRGSYTGQVFVSPSTVLRVALKNRVALPSEPLRARPVMPAFPQVPWERNRIWIWDATRFPRAKRVAYAIVDVVTLASIPSAEGRMRSASVRANAILRRLKSRAERSKGVC